MARLPEAQRLKLAELSGVAARWGNGDRRDAPRVEAVAAVHEVTTDPWLLGIEQGSAAADPQGISGPIVELMRAAGADQAVAAEHEATSRARLRGMGIRDRPAP